MASSSSTNAGSSIAYLIPEFPGQTHAFFWRERARLHRLGDRVAIFTTGKPPEELRARHAWAEEAEALTRHLTPLDARALRDIASELRRAGREGLARVARAMAASTRRCSAVGAKQAVSSSSGPALGSLGCRGPKGAGWRRCGEAGGSKVG